MDLIYKVYFKIDILLHFAVKVVLEVMIILSQFLFVYQSAVVPWSQTKF